MIYSKLKGRLGNQMFQYATIRTIAEEKENKFCFQEPSLNFVNSIKERTRLLFGKANRYNFCNISNYFDLSDRYGIVNRLNQLNWSLCNYKYELAYTEKDHVNQIADISNIQDWTYVDGYFQSQEYFLANRDNVINWFTPKPNYLKRLNALENKIIGKETQVCCVHIRRSDYKNIEYANRDEGWALPIEYYRRAIEQLNNVGLIIFITDDPEWVDTTFSWVKSKFVCRNEAPVVDMFLMSRCKYNIIANSTFSWWGAWLNNKPDKVVIAPKYFLGWATKNWSPIGIGVSEWKYIDLSS